MRVKEFMTDVGQYLSLLRGLASDATLGKKFNMHEKKLPTTDHSALSLLSC